MVPKVETSTYHFIDGKNVLVSTRISGPDNEIIIEETDSNHQVSLEYIEHENMWQATWINNRGIRRRMRYYGFSDVERVKSIVIDEDANKKWLN